MIHAIGLALAASMATATTEAPPYLAVLDAYKAACADLSSYAAAKSRVEHQGWKAFVPAADTTQAILANNKRRGFQGVQFESVFVRDVAGAPAYLFLMKAKERPWFGEPIGTGVHCRLHYPASNELVPVPVVADWMGRSVAETQASYSGSFDTKYYSFRPGLGGKNLQTRIDFVTDASMFADEGTGLVIWSIDRNGKD